MHQNLPRTSSQMQCEYNQHDTTKYICTQQVYFTTTMMTILMAFLLLLGSFTGHPLHIFYPSRSSSIIIFFSQAFLSLGNLQIDFLKYSVLVCLIPCLYCLSFLILSSISLFFCLVLSPSPSSLLLYVSVGENIMDKIISVMQSYPYFLTVYCWIIVCHKFWSYMN